jgi:DNA-binding MarR family transcriptional regulator
MMVVVAPKELSDRDYETLASFRYALRKFLRFSDDAARSAGMTPHQHQLLLVVRGWPGDTRPSITDVAEWLQLRHHSAVELVQRAAANGLVTVRHDDADGRRQLLQLTALGRRRLTEVSLANRDELRRFRTQFERLIETLE